MTWGAYEAFANRGGACAMQGHLWTDMKYNFSSGEFEPVPEGDRYCAWCKQYTPLHPRLTLIQRLRAVLSSGGGNEPR